MVRSVPELLVFWKGIYLAAPRLNPMEQYNLYFYLKSLINLSKQNKLTKISEKNDIQSKISKGSFNVLCFCDQNSYENKFIELFSYKPSMFPINGIYSTSSKDSIEFLKSKFNIDFGDVVV